MKRFTIRTLREEHPAIRNILDDAAGYIRKQVHGTGPFTDAERKKLMRLAHFLWGETRKERNEREEQGR